MSYKNMMKLFSEYFSHRGKLCCESIVNKWFVNFYAENLVSVMNMSSCLIHIDIFSYSLVYIISAVASPVFGFLIDKSGKNIFWVCLGVLVTIGCHGLLAFTFVNPYVSMVSHPTCCMSVSHTKDKK